MSRFFLRLELFPARSISGYYALVIELFGILFFFRGTNALCALRLDGSSGTVGIPSANLSPKRFFILTSGSRGEFLMTGRVAEKSDRQLFSHAGFVLSVGCVRAFFSFFFYQFIA